MTASAAPITLNSGVEMPALGLGVFQSSPAETIGAVEAAIAGGYRLIDTAAAYGNEREVGEGIRRSGIDRSEMFVTTKLWISDYGYEPARRGFDRHAGLVSARRRERLPVHRRKRRQEPARAPDDRRARLEVLQDARTDRAPVAHRARRLRDPEVGQATRIAENIDIFDFALTPDEVTAIDALDTGVRGGPDPELVDTKLYPFKVEN